MCKKRARFISSRATVVARRGNRGAIELATYRHVLEKRDKLGKKKECNWGVKYSLIFKVGFYVDWVEGRRESNRAQTTSPRDSLT